MANLAHLKLGGIAALYLFWLVIWLVLGRNAFGPDYYSWDQSLAAGISALVAFYESRRVTRPYAAFLGMQGISLLMLAASWVFYDPLQIQSSFRTEVPVTLEYSDISYAGCVFVWLCAWGYFVLNEWRLKQPSALTAIVFALLIFGLALILAHFYYPLYGSGLGNVEGRLNAVIAAIEFFALIAGLFCVLLGQSAPMNWMLLAMSVMVASDMAYSQDETPEAIPAVWMLGQFLLLGSLLDMPRQEPFSPHAVTTESLAEDFSRTERSGLSGVLVLLPLGAVLLSVAVWAAPIHSVWKSFFSVLFVVVLFMVMAWITARFDDTVQYLGRYTAKLHQGRLEADDWRQTAASIRAILRSTGLGAYLDTLRDSANRLKQDILFLGPERLFPPPKLFHDRGRVRCFIVMPFSREWSADVHRTLVDACKTLDVCPVRGDDVFTPTDILDDIWLGINDSTLVIADITDRNPNVLYELGIAHTLAKPVIILSRNAGDIPIDLSSRRVILYGQNEKDWHEVLLRKVSESIKETLNLNSWEVPDQYADKNQR